MKGEFSDTSADVARRQRAALAALSGGERVRMACDMFEAARILVWSSLPDDVGCDPVESRIRLLKRFYGSDLDPGFLERVERMIRRAAAPPPAR